MSRTNSRWPKRLRIPLAFEHLEERNAPTPANAGTVADSGWATAALPDTASLAGASFLARSDAVGVSSRGTIQNLADAGPATAANHLQIVPPSWDHEPPVTVSAPPPSGVVTAGLAQPQLFDDLGQNPLEIFALRVNQHSTGGTLAAPLDQANGGVGANGGGGGGAVSHGGAGASTSAAGAGSNGSSAGGGAASAALTSAQPSAASSTSTAAQASLLAPQATAAGSTAQAVSAAGIGSFGAPGSASPNASTTPSLLGPTRPLIHQGGSPPIILPILYANSADNPQRELVQMAGNAQAQNPMSQAFSPAGVRYADGTISLSTSDLVSAGFGSNPWGQTRNWTNGPGYATSNINGTGWVLSQLPTLQQTNNGNTIVAVTSGTDARFFDYNGFAWLDRYFLQDSLVPNTGNQEFALTDDTGKTLRFYDFSSGIPTAQQGTFKSLTDQFGNVTSVTAHTASGQIQEVQSSNTVGSTTITESYLYTYLTSGVNAGLLQNVTLRRQVNGGAWSCVRQASYAYYDGTQTYGGNTGDLLTATIQDSSGNTCLTPRND